MSIPEVVADDRLQVLFGQSEIDIGALWEVCAHFEWADRQATVDGIADWLGPWPGLKVLDCACGSGFPAIELIRRGYDVSCSDGSAAMLRHFRRNARGVEVEPVLARWEELAGEHGTGRFDVVLCRGCSFLYAGTWDRDLPPDRAALATAMAQFVACLRPGGRLYVDTAREESLSAAGWQPSPRRRLVIGSRRVELEERLMNVPDDGIRVWQSRLTIDGRKYEFERRSHHLRHDELTALMSDAGLVEISRQQVAGEHYQVFTGRRPA
jgi:SAM-dependent methyltransferase